jgi:hypothetical protein
MASRGLGFEPAGYVEPFHFELKPRNLPDRITAHGALAHFDSLRGSRHRSGHRYPRPDPAQAFQDWCPHQDQLPTHSSGVSQRLSLPGNFLARLCQSLRDAGGLNLQRAPCRHKKSELTSSQRTLPKTLILQATKTQRARPGSPTRLTNPKSPAPTDFTGSEIFSDTPNEIACEQCGLEQMPK